MSRTIDATDQTQMSKQFNVEPILVAEIVWSGSDTKYYATKGLGNEDGSSPAKATGSLMGIENFSEQIKVGNSGNINNISLDIMGLRSYFDSNTLQGKICSVYQYFWDGSTLTTGTLMFTGTIASPIDWSEESDNLSFDVVSMLPDSEYGFALDSNDSYSYTPDDDAYDIAFPLVFGECLNVPSLKVQSGIIGKLVTQMNRTTATVEVEGGEDFLQDTSMSVLFGTVVCTGTMTGKVFTPTARNLARYTSLSLASIPPGDDDEDNYCVIWINSVVTVKGSYMYDSTLDMINFCFRQETVSGTQTKCWCSTKWGSWTANGWVDQRPAGISEVAGGVRDSWNNPVTNFVSSWTIKADAPVIRLDGSDIDASAQCKYVCALTAGTVLDVKAYRTIEKEKILVNIPTSYYTITSEDAGSGSNSIVLTMNQLLSTRNDEGWSDDVFVSIDSDLTNNTATVIKYLLDTYSTLAVNSDSHTLIETAVANYPSNFVLFNQGDTLKICEEIAWQARMALRVANNTVFMRYLSIEPTVIDAFITNDDFELQSTHMSLTDEVDIITKFVAKWKKSYSPEDSIQKYVLKQNITEYGLTISEYDFWIYNIQEWAEKSADFWAHRYANVWKLLDFTSFMDNLNLEALDTVLLRTTIHNLVTASTIAIVQGVSIEQSQGKVALALWLPVVSGTQTTDADAWMLDEESRIDVDVSTLRQFNYEIELEEEARTGRTSQTGQQRGQAVTPRSIEGMMLTGNTLEDAQPATSVFCNISPPSFEKAWIDGRNPDYILGEPVTRDSGSYVCKQAHTPAFGNRPEPGGNAQWFDLSDVEVYSNSADPTLNIQDMEYVFVEGMDINVAFVNGVFIITNILHPVSEFEEIFKLRCVQDAPSDTKINCQLTNVDTGASWGSDTYYPNYRFIVNNAILYSCKVPHISNTNFDEPGVGVNWTFYWNEHTTAIEVHFEIKGETNLDDLSEPLVIGDIIYVKYNSDTSQFESIQVLYAGGGGSEGTLAFPVADAGVGLTIECYKDFDATVKSIDDLTDGGANEDEIDVTGDFADIYLAGRTIAIADNSVPGNNIEYTIVSSAESGGTTTIKVPTGSIIDASGTGGTVTLVPEEITVTCNIMQGDDLNKSIPLLEASKPMLVKTVGDVWYHETTHQGVEQYS